MHKLALLLLFSVSLSAQLQDKTREQCVATVDFDLLIAGAEAEKSGTATNPARAMATAGECIRLHPGFAAAHARRGDLYVQQEKFEAALADYSRAIELEPKEVRWYVGRGYAHLRQDHFDKAQGDYDKALQLEPSDIDALISRGDLYRVQGDSTRAVEDYNKAIAASKQDFLGDLLGARAYHGRGLLLMIAGKYDLAISDFTSAIAGAGTDGVLSYESRALAYELLEKRDLALADYDALLEIDPRNAEAYQRRGDIHLKKGNREKAKTDFQEALKLDPKNDAAKKALVTLAPQSASDYVALAREQANADNFGEAVRSYTEAIRLDGRSAEAYTGRGSAYMNQNAQEPALADYTKAIELDSRALNAYNGRAGLYASRGDRERAVADYSRTIELASAGEKFENILALTGRADIYREQGKAALALADYDKGVAVAATDSMYNYILGPDVLLGRSRLHLAAGKREAARADLQAALKLNPKHEVVKAELAKLEPQPAAPQSAAAPQAAPAPQTAEEWLKFAMRQARQNDADGAIVSLTKCLDLKADMLPCLVFRGNARAVKGQYDSASADYARAIALDPNHPAAYAGRGIMFAKQGKRDEAIRDLRTALRLKPDFGDAKQALQRLGAEP